MRVHEMRQLWTNVLHPILYRPGDSKPLMLRLAAPGKSKPQIHSVEEFQFLFRPKHHHPRWDMAKRHWELPNSWLDWIVRRVVQEKGTLYLVQYMNSFQTCSRQCQEAKGFDCECSCMGARHGENDIDSGWYEVTDLFAVKSEGQQLSCRLIVSTPD